MQGTALIFIIFLFSTVVVVFSLWWNFSLRKEIDRKEEDTKHRMYELAVLKELGDRISYSLNIEKIADIITGSLGQLIEYDVSAYMILEPDKVFINIDLKNPVSADFINEMRKRMFESVSALLGKDFSATKREEVTTGAIVSSEEKDIVQSFFNIPLVIGDEVVGVLTVADRRGGLYKENEMTIFYKIVAQASRAVSRLREAVMKEEEKISAMIETIRDGIVMTDRDYRVIVANPSAKALAGLKKEERLTIFDIIKATEGSIDVRGRLEESMKIGRTFTIADVLVKDQVFEIFVAPVKAGVGEGIEALGGVIIFHDVSGEKAAERMREDFVSMMVHELRSPLDGIKKMGEFINSDAAICKDEGALREYMHMIYDSSSDMLDLVNDLLDVAKSEAGKFDIDPRPTNLRQIIAERIKFFETVAKSDEVELASLFGEHVPDEVFVDPGRIAQVLNNLISNALKFTAPGGKVMIQTLFHRKGTNVAAEASAAGVEWFVKDGDDVLKDHPDCIVMAVTDTGEGISEKSKGMLFNKFKQFEASAKSSKRGTGLGLVIAKAIVEAHEGKIGVDSREGVGSTFYFTIKQ